MDKSEKKQKLMALLSTLATPEDKVAYLFKLVDKIGTEMDALRAMGAQHASQSGQTIKALKKELADISIALEVVKNSTIGLAKSGAVYASEESLNKSLNGSLLLLRQELIDTIEKLQREQDTLRNKVYFQALNLDTSNLMPLIKSPAIGYVLTATDLVGGASYQAPGGGTGDHMVKVDISDTTPGFLASKVAVGPTLALSTVNPGGNEQLQFDVVKQMSIVSDASGLKLSGDAASPGNSQYYGTNGAGAKGYFALPTVASGNLTDAGTDGIVVTGGTGAVLGAGTSLAQHVADASHNGYLSSADWTTFNGKQNALTIGNLTDVGTDGIVVTGGTGAVIGAGTSLAQHVADTTHNGYLSSTDWTTFNGKQNSLTIGNLTDVGTDGITVTGGTGAVIGSGTSLSQHVADSTHNGYLASGDWTTFNSKVTSVSGTANRITSTGGTTPVIDISAAYVGQSSITTLGTITTGVWTGTNIALANGGTGAGLSTPSGADKLWGWDNTDGQIQFITIGTGLAYTHSTHTLSASGGGSGTVNSGVAGRLALYPATGTTVDDVYVQNANNIDILIAAQGTRSAGIEYTIPNPGDAVTAVNFVVAAATFTNTHLIKADGTVGVQNTGWLVNSNDMMSITASNNSSYMLVVTNTGTTIAAAINGSATGATGVNYGVIGHVSSTTDTAAAVYGSADGATGNSYGVYGHTASSGAGAYSIYSAEQLYVGNYADFKAGSAAANVGGTSGVDSLWLDANHFFNQSRNTVVVTPVRVIALNIAAGTTGLAPLTFASGTNNTSAQAGAMEYDGKVHYSTHAASERGVASSVQHITLTTAYTTTSLTGTALQALFNAPTNGTLTVAGNTTYYFECAFSLSAMSATPGVLSFGLGGTATYTSVSYIALADKSGVVPSAPSMSWNTGATAKALVASTVSTAGEVFITGKIIIGNAGTIIPSFAVSQAANVVVATDSYFKIWPAGADTVQSVGNWS